jgi:Ser/Thr protein kinase RdoA (MazF antagonist)
VPEVVAADLTGSDVGDGIPVVLMSHLPGQPLADPDPMRLATTAAAIHAIDGRALGHEYYRWFDDDMAKPPPLSTRPELWERAIDLWRVAMPTFTPVLIHRDFHPGNVLWRHRVMTGIVDWANACTGPAGCDVATCRANLVGWAGPPAAEAFVAAYESITGAALHPYWQMANLLESDPADWTTEHLAAHEPTLARLVSTLA